MLPNICTPYVWRGSTSHVVVGLDSNVMVDTSLVNGYDKMCLVSNARQVFLG